MFPHKPLRLVATREKALSEMPILVVYSKDGNRSYPLEEGKPMFLGRAKECDILLPSPAVSRRHAVILYKNGICGVKDLGSFNGTELNGNPVAEPRHLTENDTLRISSFTIRLHYNAPVEDSAPPAPPPAETNPTEKTWASSDATASEDPNKQAPPPRPDARTYPRSTLRIPRAMNAGDQPAAKPPTAVRRKDDPDETQYGPPGDAPTPLPANADETRDNAGAPIQVEEPPDSADDSDDGQLSPSDTAYFKEDVPEPETPYEVTEIVAEHAESAVDAEAVIPLHDPEVAPRLALDEDEATTAALEELVADLPAREDMRDFWNKDKSAQTAKPEIAEEPEDEPQSPQPDETDGREDIDENDPDSGDDAYSLESASDTAETAPPGVPVLDGLENIAVSPALAKAIDARLLLYPRLLDLNDERKLFRSAARDMSPEMEEEFARQESELNRIPTAEEAVKQIRVIRARLDAAASGRGPAMGEEMRTLYGIGESQLLLIRESNLESLPVIYKEAYRLAADEPLAVELSKARIGNGRLMGGAIYLLALESLTLSANGEQDSGADLPEKGGETEKSGILSRLGKFAQNLTNRGEVREEPAGQERQGIGAAERAKLARREMRFMERTLIGEFARVYAKTASRFIPHAESMPPPVRAFLRHGAIGFKRWWMRPEVREYILRDCEENIAPAQDVDRDRPKVLYADEYLAAVAQMECSPSPDESLAELGRNSVEAKTDRAYRRIVNSRGYNVLMEKMLTDLEVRMKTLAAESKRFEERIAEAKASARGRENLFDLQTEHQSVEVRMANLEKHIKRIETEIVASIIESVQEAEGRFRKGELHIPDSDALLGKEVDALLDLSRRMAGSREWFMPMVLREHFPLDRDVVGDRATVREKLAELEERDPGIFVTTVIQAKRKRNRVELKNCPIVVLLPCRGMKGICPIGREGMEGGRLVLPTCFAREDIRDRQIAYLLADFRWETSRLMAGRDVMNSETLVGVFMKLRWEWRNYGKSKREKGLVFNENKDRENWRRVYEVYLSDADRGARTLFLRNPELYAGIIGKYIDLPDGVDIIRRSVLD